jgi:hypothetical protein
MRLLLAALMAALSNGQDNCPAGFEPRDWDLNIGLAKHRLQKRWTEKGRWSQEKILDAVIPRRRRKGPKQQLCPACHTPILVGYRLNGRKITRRKVFCDDACKMNLKRQKERRRGLAADH